MSNSQVTPNQPSPGITLSVPKEQITPIVIGTGAAVAAFGFMHYAPILGKPLLSYIASSPFASLTSVQGYLQESSNIHMFSLTISGMLLAVPAGLKLLEKLTNILGDLSKYVSNKSKDLSAWMFDWMSEHKTKDTVSIFVKLLVIYLLVVQIIAVPSRLYGMI